VPSQTIPLTLIPLLSPSSRRSLTAIAALRSWQFREPQSPFRVASMAAIDRA
jgi:hypothetical protein